MRDVMNLFRILVLTLAALTSVSLLDPALIAAPGKACENIGKLMAQRFGQRYLTHGLGCLVGVKNETYHHSISLADSRKMTLEQGKCLAADMLKAYLDLALSTPIFDHYRKAARADQQMYLPQYPSLYPEKITPDLFGFKVGFWDENVDRPFPPYLAQIRAAESKVYFYYADPKTKALQEPPAEVLTYDELLTWRRHSKYSVK